MTSREEIAARLRESITTRTTDEVYIALLNCIGITYDYANLFNRLADLIDSTCKYLPCVCVTWVDDNDEEHEEENLEEPGYSENAYCSVCGYEMMSGEEGWFDYERKEHGNLLIPNFNYCPNCGARVVRDEA